MPAHMYIMTDKDYMLIAKSTFSNDMITVVTFHDITDVHISTLQMCTAMVVLYYKLQFYRINYKHCLSLVQPIF
jgi:hypothetical protein